MAKSKGKKKKGEPGGAPDPLRPALDAFSRGDYPEARRLFDEKIEDPDVSESEKGMARAFRDATGLEKGALWVGLGCLGLFLLVVLVTALKQP